MGLFSIPHAFRYIFQVPLSFFSAVANALNNARGENGVTLERGASGELIVKIGDAQYDFRPITTCDRTFTEDGELVLLFQRITALCSRTYSAQYLQEVEGGGGAANDDPESPKLINGTANAPLGEGTSDDEMTDTYDPADAGQDGVSVWVLCRERYDHEGSMKWYAYWRKLTWPSGLAPRVSAEKRVEIDTPVAYTP